MNFRSISVDEVWVDRTKRQRRELKGIEELAESIRARGLINPIVVTEYGELIAGERRLTAARHLGLTHIVAQFLSDLPEDEAYAIELEENIKREDLSWQDQVAAVKRYHELRARQNPEWTQTQTAEALGIAPQTVSTQLVVAEGLAKQDPDIVNAPKYSVARNLVQRKQARAAKQQLDLVGLEDPPEEPTAPIYNEDFRKWAEAYTGPKFNLIHCDFPYGINADKHHQGASSSLGGYADTEDVYWELMDTLSSAMENVVSEEAHLVFWFSMDFYDPTLMALEDMGWTVQRFPLVWHKNDNTGILPDPARGPRRIYETAFLASRGDRKIVRAVGNCYAAPVTKEFHMSEKNEAMLHHFLRMLIDDSTTFLDPTCGSGSAVRVARDLGARRFVGLEVNADFHSRAVEHFND